MAQGAPRPEAPPAAAEGSPPEGPRTSQVYRVQEGLPPRFDHPGWFRGYRMKERNPLFRTTNMDYGGKPPTVHEMPTCFHASPHTFTDHLIKFGMYRNTGINTSTEKSEVTGPDNFITCFDTFNFHPSYRTGGPSFCE
uniref:piercer of microtubule wall 1 protein n=1 Tax=Euleptes europaea TaxID=460621 RepID=UPI002541A49C|nr:piercer of microtubule wall 1 protein [Euleptes europaea]